MQTKAAEPKRRRANVGKARAKGMRSVSRVTGVTTAASIVLAAVFSAVAAWGFSGHSASASSAPGSGTTAAAGAQRVALPPRGKGATLTPPAAPPISQNAAPAVTSGGS